jgi:hypothetical protein
VSKGNGFGTVAKLYAANFLQAEFRDVWWSEGDFAPAILFRTAWAAYFRLIYDVKVGTARSGRYPASPTPDCPAIALPRGDQNQGGQWCERATSGISMRGRFPVDVCTVADHRATQKPSIIQTLLLMTAPIIAR